MGVPKFYRWMSERYPCLNQVVRESEIPEFDNLYLDMNGIIHACSHPNDEDVHFRLPEEVMVKDIFKYIETLFNIIKPKKTFFMAVDGVAPRAKMNQQRGRRFRSAKDAIAREVEAQNKGEILPKEARFDSNCITPGTDFMARLQAHLEYFVTTKVSNDELWRNVTVILSGHETPGEGEHKIMDFIRTQRSQPDYDPNTRHCLYGLDADLIMLGMCSHEPYFALLREEVKFRRRKEKETTFHVNPEAINFHLLHLSLLRDYLDHEFSPLKTILPFQYDLEHVIDDWVLMGFLCGNDFIPHLPHFHIAKNALTTLYKVYMEVLPNCDGYLNHHGKLNLRNFQKFLHKLSEIDVENFNEMNADFKYLESKSRSKFKCPRKLEKYEDSIGVVGEYLESGPDSDSNLIDLGSDEASDEVEEDDEEDESSSEEDDTLEDEFKMHKRDYYRTKMNYEDVTPEVLKEQAYCYIKAIQWNLHYYYDGCPSWSWYYPHHYAPYISDVKSFENIDLTFNLGQPFKPFEQLLGVLPAASKEFLPKPYQRLVTDENSPLKDYYPADFELDLNGKVNSWEAVVVIPFIDENKLLNAAQSCESQLTVKEKKRNSHGPHLQFNYSRDLQPRMPSTIPTILPDIEVNRAKKTLVNKNEYCIPRNSIRKGVLPGIDLDVYTPGFPTLRTMKHTARLEKASIRVFEMPSSGSSILIDLTPKPEISLQSALVDYLGQTVYINWPFLTEAKVSKICDGDKLYVLNSSGQQDVRELRDKEKRETAGQVRSVVETLKNRRGIHLPEFNIVFYCKPLTGCKYNLGSNGQVSLDKQWSPIENCVPYPMAIKKLPIRLSSYERTKKMEEIFPIGSKCFILMEEYYGDIATIEEVQKKTNKVKVKIHRVSEPDLDEVKGRGYELMNKEYMTNHALASKLGLNPCLVSRLTGVVMIEKSNGDKVNIGLNLKFVTRKEYVPGYSQRREETWLFSWKTYKIMEEYSQKYPELFTNLSKLSDQKRFQPNQIFNGPDPESKISEVAAWLKKMPYQNTRRMKYDAEALDEVVVKCIEDVLDSHKVFANELDTVKTVFSTNQVFRPANIIGHSPPDPTATFNLFDRVVNVREGISVPLGARGVIIGKTKDKLDDDTYLCDIVFDEPFIGGLSLNCSQGRGYRLHPYNLINISFKKMRICYGEDVDLAPIQPVRSGGGVGGHRDKRSRTKASPGQKKLINLSPNRNHERHDYANKRDYLDQGNQNVGHCYQSNNHNSNSNNYHNEQRNNGKQRVMSSPIQINHSPRSLFQNPREAKNNAINHCTNKTTVPTSILTRVKQEASPPDDSHMLVASSGSSASASTTPKTFTGNQFMDMIRAEQNKGPARIKLDDWCKLKFGKEPIYKMESLGPGAANPLNFATLKLPDSTKLSQSNPNSAKSDLVFENLAIEAIHRLKIEPGPSGGVPAPFEPPTSILPPPPPPTNWIEQKDLEAQIPSSYVTANQKIIQSVVAERKQTPSIHQVMRANAQRSPVNHQYYNSQSQQQKHHHQSNQQQQHLQNEVHQHYLHHHQQPQQQQKQQPLLSPLQQNLLQQHYQPHSNYRNGNNNNNRNVQCRGPLLEGPIMTTRPVAMQPFQQNLQPNLQKPKLRPHYELSRPPQGPRAQASKFIPLQVERNKQPQRDTNQNHYSTNSNNPNQQKRNEVQQQQPRKQQITTPVENKTIESKKNEINENRTPKTPDPVDTAVKSSNRRRSRVVMSFAKP